MADRGHILTETILAEIEDRCKEEYEIAAREMRKKYRDYMAAFEEGRKQQYALWQAGKISKEEYTNWVYRHTMIGKRWEKMADTLAADMQRTNEMALAIAQGRMPDVFALNGNYATYQIEHDGKIDTGFTLYNHDTAAYLMEDRQLMPGPSSAKAAEIAADKTMQWNKRKIQSAVLQGVLQGESPYQIADRLRSVAEMNYHASVRYARTMTTSAQNAGRYESFHRADKLGVDLTLEWQATLDGRTRHTHRLLHGMRTTVDKPFVVDGVKIMYPAQSAGPGASDIPQALIWNCRCTILAWVKGFEGDTVKSSPKMGKMTFEEWQHAKEPKKKENVAQKATTTKKEQLTLTSVTTHEELANYLSDKYNISCSDDFENLDLDKVKVQVEAMEKMYERYPFIRDEVKNFKVASSGVMSCGGGDLTFNPKYFAPGGASLKDSHARQYASKWWSAKGEGATVLHELGHAVEGWIGNQAYTGVERILAWNEGWEARQIVKTALSNIKKTPFGKGKKVQDLLDDMSRYGGSDKTRCEALAEAFANVFDTETETHPLAAEIVRLTEERVKEFGGAIK